MAKARNFSGVIAPVLTPFGDDGAPDPDRFIDHAHWLIEEGCTALAPFGTTSEANSLGLDERLELLEALIDGGIDPAMLMPGTGACSVPDAVILTEHAVDAGCKGCLMLPPFYYKNPSEEGLYRFFSDVIEDVGEDDLRIYLYHIPPVAQVGFPLPLIGRLKKAFPGVIAGMKDSSGDWSNMKAVLETHPDLEFFPGSELHLLDGLRNGAAGVISATANVTPGPMRALFDSWEKDAAGAEAQQASISALRNAVQAYPVVPLLKALVAHYRGDEQWAEVRPPFEVLDAAIARKAITELAEKHGLKLDFDEAA
jgi:4-hydroxy-tetrahydrodipicolinate synthase